MSGFVSGCSRASSGSGSADVASRTSRTTGSASASFAFSFAAFPAIRGTPTDRGCAAGHSGDHITERLRPRRFFVGPQTQPGEADRVGLLLWAVGDSGSVEAVKQSLEKLSDEKVQVKVIHAAAGAVTESDVTLAKVSNAIIIAFNVRPVASAKEMADREEVEIKQYSVIYQAIEDVEAAMKGMWDPEFEEKVIGTVEVRQTFKVSGVGTIAGGYVLTGKVERNAGVRVIRDDVVIHQGELASLKRFKDDVKEVAKGYECGLQIANYNDIKEGDIIEVYVMEEIKR